jgi:transcriptional regulator with XRE-family HTH domain
MKAFNSELFSSTLTIKKGQRSVRHVARITGVSSATISRTCRGNLPDINTFFILCKWMEVDPSTFKHDS